MKCPKCGHRDTNVTDTRVAPDYSSVRRRRKCHACGYRFPTMEIYCKTELIVIKRNGSEEDFDPEKIISSLQKAIKSGDGNDQKVENAMRSISQSIREYHDKKITAKHIGQIVMEELKQVDPIAYLRFTSVCKNFQEIREFEQEFKQFEQQEFENQKQQKFKNLED